MRGCDPAFVLFSLHSALSYRPILYPYVQWNWFRDLIAHLRRKKPVKLYLEATGSVVCWLPDQKKTCFALCTCCSCSGWTWSRWTPLPVAEMLTNSHNVPSISSRLLQFLHQIRQFTVMTISHVETDFSWALMQAVLLAFNEKRHFFQAEEMLGSQPGQAKMKNSKKQTVLHVCAAHVMKAVSGIISKHVTD